MAKSKFRPLHDRVVVKRIDADSRKAAARLLERRAGAFFGSGSSKSG